MSWKHADRKGNGLTVQKIGSAGFFRLIVAGEEGYGVAFTKGVQSFCHVLQVLFVGAGGGRIHDKADDKGFVGIHDNGFIPILGAGFDLLHHFSAQTKFCSRLQPLKDRAQEHRSIDGLNVDRKLCGDLAHFLCVAVQDGGDQRVFQNIVRVHIP